MSRVERNIKKLDATKTRPPGHRVCVEATSPQGERQTFKKTFRGEGSLKAARDYRDRIERKLDTGELWREQKLQAMTIGRYALERYLPRIRDRNTRDDFNQKRSAAKHYLPKFGDTPITDLRPGDIEDWVYELEKKTKSNGEPYARETLQKYVQCFRTLVTEMCRRFGVRNPFERVSVKPRHIKGGSKKRKVATRKELAALHEGLRRRVKEARSKDSHGQWLPKRELMLHLFKVQFLTGCRSGEVVCLEKQHFKGDEGIVVVEYSLDDQGGKGPTKRGKLANDFREGIRRVPVSDVVMQVVDAWLDRRTELGFPDVDTVFTRQNGELLRPQNIREHYKKACAEMDSTSVTPHMLRHTLNDMLRRQGTQRLARQALLGHADGDTNLAYTDPRAEEARPALENVVELVEFQDGDEDDGQGAAEG